jgi:undecaprenyl pyrophosphate phosphatase UppP
LYWQLLLVALVIAAIAGLGRDQMSGAQLAMLCGMSSVLVAWALVLAILRRRKRQRGEHEAP